MPLISTKNLALAYDGQRVIDGLSFTVEVGGYLCIVGENGSGKSTLLRGLLGLMLPVEGEIIRDAALSRGDIGYLPQQTKLPARFSRLGGGGCALGVSQPAWAPSLCRRR